MWQKLIYCIDNPFINWIKPNLWSRMLRVLFFIASFHSVLYAQNSLAKDSLRAKDLFKQGCNQILSEHFGESLNTFQELLAFQEQKFPTFDRSYPSFLDRNLARFYMGLGYLRTSKPQNALESLTQSLQQMRTNPTYKHDTLWVGTSQTMLAYIAESYSDLGLYDISIEHYLEAESLAKTLNPFSKYPALSLIYTNIALTYAKAKDFKNCILYDYKALEIDKMMGENPQSMAINYGNLAEHFRQNQQLDSAETYLNKAFIILQKQDFPMIRANVLNTQSGILALQNRQTAAIDTLLSALVYAQQTGQKKQQSQIFRQLSTYYLEIGKAQNALQCADSAISYAKDMVVEKTEALHTKANAQKALGLFEQALSSRNEAASSDSLLLQKQLLNYIAGMETHIRIKDTLTQTQQEVTAKKKQLWVSWLIAILLILLLLALYYTYKSSKKAYRAESEKFEMERRAHQAEAIKAAILESELVAKELAYESLQTELSELQMQLQPPINHSSSTDIPLSKSTHHFDFAIDKIIYCQGGADNYVDIFVFPNKKYTERITLKKLEAILPPQKFRRVHKSYIINFDFLEKEKNDVFIMKTGESIPRSRNR